MKKPDRSSIERMRKIISLPLEQKINTLNRYIETTGIDSQKIEIDKVKDHRGKGALVDRAYSLITKPHQIYPKK